MSTLKTVAVVVGGESAEHEISLLSGAEVLANIDPKRWRPFVVRIGRDGAWHLPPGLDPRAEAPALSLSQGIDALLAQAPDVVFPCMHGPYGEDGRFQALCELLHLPYVGSGSGASALAMHKARARDVLAAAGLQIAPAQELRRGEPLTIDAPCVVKPMRLGSSVGLMVVRDTEDLRAAVQDALIHDDHLLIEAFVTGRELTAGVLEDAQGRPEALPLVEIRPKTADFFDFEAKYTPGATDEICPALIPDALRDRIQTVGLTAHRALGCRGMSRTDVIVTPDNSIVVLETNTIPGLTRMSLLPQAAAEAGIDFSALLSRLLDRGLAER